MLKSILETFTDSNGQARLSAIAGTVELSNLIPPTVSYESRGNLLIVGAYDTITALAPQFATLNSVTLLATSAAETVSVGLDTKVFFSHDVTIKGYLGAFEVNCRVAGRLLNTYTNLAEVTIGGDSFDLVVDMSVESIINTEIPAPGYYPVGSGKTAIADVIETLPDMLGMFDKPKYFRLNNDICAHSSRGVSGCTRCVDACPAGALSSNGHAIEINPFLCQGVGTCATACPTEAITYALPDPEKTQNFIYRLLNSYQMAGGVKPTILFFGNRDEENVAAQLPSLPSNVIPIALEELATVGVDTWFSALIYGAHQVLLATNIAYMPATIDRVLKDELAIANNFLTELGFEADRICLFELSSAAEFVAFPASLLPVTDNKIAVMDSGVLAEQLSGTKREKLFSALDRLHAQSTVRPTVSSVPENAPYGSVECKTDDCTLCMGCVAVCPTRALHAVGGRPGLQFREQDCVQCGLCEKACPEQVISLKPGVNWDVESRQSTVMIHEEEPACCLSCGKAFAPASMIKMLTEKLQGHSQFQGDAIRRLSMCEDCRVRDIFSDMADDPTSQLRV
ncbi:4Fe-4S dicluster domain-containing protein [Moritella sp.]|uniref:4Fe-4S dicluster domain-containing protein n=1 Tax=Moritella sp. TaxID=78556 RepID=UPI001DE78828|nr:4Fe-4S dicluster domain-containing protein [Moritella sp.]MCJ8349413.1 4Fe-4S binding protein [Moritella sp.]NQZ39271.1 4Fe-4S binding protein [Moritella sp.]